MRVAYYYADNWVTKDDQGNPTWHMHWPEVRRRVHLYADFQQGRPLPALGPGKKLWVDLGMYDAASETAAWVRSQLAILRPKWGKVESLELRDEPHSWSRAKVDSMARMVKHEVAAAGLAPKPVSATFGDIPILKGSNWTAPALDRVGIEAYRLPVAGETPTQARARMAAHIKKQVARVEALAPLKKINVVAQGYDRNGAWRNIPTLVAVQRPAFEAAKALEQRRKLGVLLIFDWGRFGIGVDGMMSFGTRGYEALKAEHNRLIAEFA